MQNKFKIYFTCNVCGLPMVDFVELDRKFWDEDGNNLITGERWDANYVDFRHTDCEKTHGKFKEMVEEYVATTKADFNEAEAFVMENRKRVDFDKELAKKVEKSEKSINNDDIIKT